MWSPSYYEFYGIKFIKYYFLFFYCLTLLLYRYKVHYVNLALHIGASLFLYLVVWVVFVGKTTISFFEIFKIFSIPIILQTIHLVFILYAIIYARKFDTQEIPFRKRLWRYIVSFIIGVVFVIASFIIMYAIGEYIYSWCDRHYLKIDERNEAIDSLTFYVLTIIFPLIILSLFGYILYKNHKLFFTKIFDRILSMVGKRKS